MRKILIGLGLAGVAALIVLGARGLFTARPDGAPPAGEARGGERVTDNLVPARDFPTDGQRVTDSTGGPAERADTGADARSGSGGSAGQEGSPAASGSGGAAVPARPPAQSNSGAAGAPEAGAEDGAALLRRASAAYEKVTSLQADFVQQVENPLLRTNTTSRGTLYQRRPDRFLMRFSDPSGDVVVSDGKTLWVYYPSVDSGQVIRSRGAVGANGMDLQAQFLNDPDRRFDARKVGTDTVAGRTAAEVELTPREAAPYARLRVWIDTGDHLVRRFDVEEENGVTRHFRLSDLRVNPQLPDSLFRFQPPAGASIVDRG